MTIQYSGNVNERTYRRTELGLTQTEAGAQAGVSLATWRRWEDEPDSVSAKTRMACERVLAASSEYERALAKPSTAFQNSWGDSHYLTPRQAYSIAVTLDGWADTDIREWLRRGEQALHEIRPFDAFDLRVMMLVGENRAWAEAVRQRCYALSDEIERGVLPFDRPGPFIDEVLIAATLSSAEAWLTDFPELFQGIPARDSVDDEGNEANLIGDDDWATVSDGFDDRCRWDDWEVPVRNGHPLLPAILDERHPFRWFDNVGASGPGYLQRLSGMVSRIEAPPATDGRGLLQDR